jgi:methylase of polypeptide subunit release factors
LDFGCGSGSYAIPAAKMVRERGIVYALDIHPLAVKAVEKKAKKLGLAMSAPYFQIGTPGYGKKA